MSKKKHQKTLDKRCPECDEPLQIVSETNVRDGIEYTDQYIECDGCGYKEKFKMSNNNFKDNFSKW